MTVKSLCRTVSALIVLFLIARADSQAQSGAGKRPTVKIIYSALTASNAPIWIGGDQGLYDKYGLDAQIIHGRGASPIKPSPAARWKSVTSPEKYVDNGLMKELETSGFIKKLYGNSSAHSIRIESV